MSPLPGAPDPAVTLARIEVKLDQALRAGADHEQRLRALEARSWPRASLNLWMAGLSAVAASAAVLQALMK